MAQTLYTSAPVIMDGVAYRLVIRRRGRWPGVRTTVETRDASGRWRRASHAPAGVALAAL